MFHYALQLNGRCFPPKNQWSVTPPDLTPVQWMEVYCFIQPNVFVRPSKSEECAKSKKLIKRVFVRSPLHPSLTPPRAIWIFLLYKLMWQVSILVKDVCLCGVCCWEKLTLVCLCGLLAGDSRPSKSLYVLNVQGHSVVWNPPSTQIVHFCFPLAKSSRWAQFIQLGLTGIKSGWHSKCMCMHGRAVENHWSYPTYPPQKG